MSDLLLRPACPDDVAALSVLWQAAFHDAAPLVRRMLMEGALLQHALTAQVDGQAVSAMYAFPGLTLGGDSAAYLYALATLPAYRSRGLGAAVLEALTDRCFAEGAALVFLSPADEGLSRWYQGLGFAPLCAMEDVPLALSDGPVGQCEAVSAYDYVNLRAGAAPITASLLAAQSVLLEDSGGGLFRLVLSGGTASACAMPTAQGLFVLELCCPKALEAEGLRTLAARFGASAILRRVPGRGIRLLYRSRNGIAPHLPQDFCFPFLLDK